ncbi:hypothetical protein BDV26DRAFT_255874 [Aspergillus bertholletiae]|uniref:Uncharacterized protein n=1 Tax=Aspergillus bertholletiae TaxID=1226010 RepID=A0A5N7BHB5_9EURO|nr:hypothetical protein BDV26DRAFT_255874 [Aspergillus bertholletiae]
MIASDSAVLTSEENSTHPTMDSKLFSTAIVMVSYTTLIIQNHMAMPLKQLVLATQTRRLT